MWRRPAARQEWRAGGRLPPPLAAVAVPLRQALPRRAHSPRALLPPLLAMMAHSAVLVALLAAGWIRAPGPSPQVMTIGLAFAITVPPPDRPVTAHPAEPPALAPTSPPAMLADPATSQTPTPASDPPAAAAESAAPPHQAPPTIAEPVALLPEPSAVAAQPVAPKSPPRAVVRKAAPAKHPASVTAIHPVASAVNPAARPVEPASLAAVAPVAAALAPAASVAELTTPPTLVGGMVGAGCPPKYPGAALRAGMQGRVEMRVMVAPDGTATEVTVVSSSGFARLDRAATDALHGCRFRPATAGGHPVSGLAEVTYRFTLEN